MNDKTQIDKTKIMERANARVREIGHEISQLENERLLLRQIQGALEVGFEDEVPKLVEQYRRLFKRVK